MITKIISYSLSGNNEKLANKVAKKLNLEHLKIREAKKRKISTIMLDKIFNRTPKIDFNYSNIKEGEHYIIFCPIWMFNIATPLKSIAKKIKKTNCTYSFVTLSGGAMNDNPKFFEKLCKNFGKKPVKFIQKLIVNLIDKEKVSPEDTSNFKLNEELSENISNEIIKELN